MRWSWVLLVVSLAVRADLLHAQMMRLPVSFFIRRGSSLFVSADGRVKVDGLRIYLDGVELYPDGARERTVIRGVDGVDPGGFLFKAVVMEDVYPGVDLLVRALGGGAYSLQWFVSPGARPQDIGMRVRGAGVLLRGSVLELGSMTLGRVRAFQGSREVPVEYRVEDGVIRFAVGPYDRDEALIIDPVLVVGSTQEEWARALAYRGGYVYVVGTFYTSTGVDSLSFPGGFNTSILGDSDVVVLKIDATTLQLVAGTYFGGSGADMGTDISVSNDGVYITGWTESTDMYTTGGTRSYSGGIDAFVARLDLDLGSVIWSTYLGGSRNDMAYGIAVGDSGVYVVGHTNSRDFPVSNGTVLIGGSDAFVSRLDARSGAIIGGTYVGGEYVTDVGRAIALSDSGVYMAGQTWGTRFKGTPGSYDPTCNGSYDGFVVRLSTELDSVLAATCLGGSANELPDALVAGPDGIYVAGVTSSVLFPDDALRGAECPGNPEAFVSKLDFSLSSLEGAICIGGSGADTALALLLLDTLVYVSGITYSSDFPVSDGAVDGTFDGEAEVFVGALSGNLDTLVAATFLGGSGLEAGTGLTTDYSYVYVAGYTSSISFPDVGPYVYGGNDIFVALIDPRLTPVDVSEEGGESTVGIADGMLVLLMKEPAYVGFDVVAPSGRVLAVRSAGFRPPGIWKFSLPSLAPGIYIIRLRVGEHVRTLPYVRH